MKRTPCRVLSLLLSLAMLVGLCMPTALATERKPTSQDFKDSFSLEVKSTRVECEPYYLERMDAPNNRHLPASDAPHTFYSAIAEGSKFTLKNTAQNGNLELSVLVMPYSLHDGKYSQDVEPGGYRLRENYFQLQVDGSEAGGKPIILTSGQSRTFDFTFKDAFASKPHTAEETGELVYVLTVNGYYPDYDWSYWANYIFMVGNEGPQFTKSGLNIQFSDDYYMSDIGPINDITITNDTQETISGVYTLLMYSPKKYCNLCNYGEGYGYTHEDAPRAELYPFDLKLEPGESVTKTAYFNVIRNLTQAKFVWVEYDDAAERDAYLNDSALFRTDTVDFAASYDNYVGYWIVQDTAYLARYPYDITLAPVTHKSN